MRQKLSPPREPRLAGLLFVSFIPTPCVAHLFEALEQRMCFLPSGIHERPSFPELQSSFLRLLALCGGTEKPGEEGSGVRTDEGLS